MAVVRLRRQPGTPGDDAALTERARAALAALADRPGYRWGVLGRSTDDPGLWVLTTRWDSVGDYRRGLSAWDVKLHAHPLLYEAVDEPTAFEVLLEVDPGGAVRESPSDRAADV
ncbi:MAG: antibiotic biosynthesis monooxygenase family protein [Kineosporiaceae bacterium]